MIDNQKSLVCVIDSDDEHRRKLNQVFSSMQFETRLYPNAESFLRVAEQIATGCVVSALRLDGMSGLELQSHLKERRSSLPVILYSERKSTQIIVRAMRLGAVTFFDWPIGEDSLWSAVDEALTESKSREKIERERLDLNDRFSGFSLGEHDVLDSICAGMTNKEIARKLDISIRTVESRRRRILDKSRSQSLPELLLSYQRFVTFGGVSKPSRIRSRRVDVRSDDLHHVR